MLEQEEWKSLWAHVEDLRKVLIHMTIIIGIGGLILFFFYEPLFHSLTSNWQQTLSVSLKKQVIQHERVENLSLTPLIYDLPNEALGVQGQEFEWIGTHRIRLPPNQFIEYRVPSIPRLLILGPLEGMLLTFKVCFWLSLALTSPLWGWIFLRFILPGLKQAEKVLLLPFILCSFIWLGGGICLAYFVTIPLANHYLHTFNASLGQNAWSLTNYIDYTLMLSLGHAIAFELSLFLLWMVHFQWISPEWLSAKRRYMIIAAFILGALLTPPDVFTQLLLAIPLVILYEVAIMYGKWRKRSLNLSLSVNHKRSFVSFDSSTPT